MGTGVARAAAAVQDTGAGSAANSAPGGNGLMLELVRSGLIRSEDLLPAPNMSDAGFAPARLMARGSLAEGPYLQAVARHYGAGLVDPSGGVSDPALIHSIGVTDCLRLAILPWKRIGNRVVVLTARPEDFARLRPMLERRLGPVLMALATAQRIEAAILARCGRGMARAAETRVPEAESCRNWRGHDLPVLLGLGLVALPAMIWPWQAMMGLFGLAIVTLILCTILKFFSTLSALTPPEPEADPPEMAQWPVISVIVALYRESDIAPRLVRRLSRLDYPREKLEVILAVEAEDNMTRKALAASDLPPWMRVVVAPPGRVKTKPRALNLALEHCRGTIVGVYDAEDAPEPDQLRKVAEQFHRRGHEVACLQGILDFYNPRTNWLSRCFTLEYASWFRLMLKGVARMRLIVPLGGTTLFFRRDVLEKLGGWDAHNVTEDADLGVRLVRHGYRTELVETTTYEEANCRGIAWVKQRSRWIKGYMMTWIVHMRRPGLLLRQIGLRRFVGFQIMFLGSILSALLAPLLWSVWFLALGGWHPLGEVLSPAMIDTLTAIFLISLLCDWLMAAIALRRSRQKVSSLWVISLYGYFPLATFAAYKALWEVIRNPFYWDKTHHGLFDSGPGAG